MRKPDEIERLYLDFDGFFASVEQQADRRLRGRPVGVVPFSGTDRTAVIACSKEAKAQGVKNVMPIAEARRVCPDLILVPQNPDLYRRAHNALLCEIETVIAIDLTRILETVRDILSKISLIVSILGGCTLLAALPILTGIIAGDKQTLTARRGFALSLAYVTGMSLSYAALGMVIGYFGARANIQTWLQTPAVLVVFAGLHGVAALKHHFIDRDATLVRMLGRKA